MSTHYYPYDADGEVERQAPCGTVMGANSQVTFDCAYVDCAVCLKRKGKIMTRRQAEEHAIINQMGDMAEFMRSQRAGQSADVRNMVGERQQ